VLFRSAHRQGRLKQSIGLSPYFARIKDRKGIRTATVATARKLCVVIHAVLSSKKQFDDTRVARLQT
jgi:hypothetical protein